MKEGSRNSRIAQDNDDYKALQDFLKKSSLFKKNNFSDSFRNIVTRVHGTLKVHVDTTITVVFKILSDMIMIGITDYHFKAYKL